MKREPRAPGDKLLSRDAMAAVMETRREQRSVFTNGCFDLLHVGHVDYLFRARALGDFLIVGLNDDDSVRRLKGEKRPLNRADDRALLLAALEAVDYVVLFSEDTPLQLLERLRPALYVKAADYRVEDLPETPLVRSWGGTVQIMPFVEGRSTTDVVRVIRERYCE